MPMFGKDYWGNSFPNERKLYRKYGRCRPLHLPQRCVFVSDTHGLLWEKEAQLSNFNGWYCFLLGDHEFDDIDIILDYFPKERIYALLGNHDLDYISKYELNNLHGKRIKVNGASILGCGGAYKYKQHVPLGMTQEESRLFFQDKPYADILLSHDGGYDESKLFPKEQDNAHMGLYGITEYIFSRGVPLHIHGHTHEEYEHTFLNGTMEIALDKVGLHAFGNIR